MARGVAGSQVIQRNPDTGALEPPNGGNINTATPAPEGAFGLTDEERALSLGDLITRRMKDALAMASNVKDLNAVLATAVKWEAVQRKLDPNSGDDEPGGAL